MTDEPYESLPFEQRHQRVMLNVYGNYLAPYMDIHAAHFDTADNLDAVDRFWLKNEEKPEAMTFIGQITGDTSVAFEGVNNRLRGQHKTALFRENDDPQSPHRVHIVRGRPAELNEKPNWWVAIVLFIATIASVLYTGTVIAVGEIGLNDPRMAREIAGDLVFNLWRGAPYAAAILLILGVHEMGHYIMMRRRKTPSSPPYFIPGFGISLFGTFGAVIMLQGQIRDRRALLDIGAAGPIAGFIVALPILLVGLATSTVQPFSNGLAEGDSLLYIAAKILTQGRYLPADGLDVLVNQWAWAGWTGMLVTALNLIPLGQLDGGHIAYALLGRSARRLYWPVMVMLVGLMLFVSQSWLVFVILLALFGRRHAVPLNAITGLDHKRRIIAFVAGAIFILTFTPAPLVIRGAPNGLLASIMLTLGLLAYARPFNLFRHRRTDKQGKPHDLPNLQIQPDQTIYR